MNTLTERGMLNHLHDRYQFVRPGTTTRRWIVAEHVRAACGYDVRTADFVAQDTWEAQGLPLHGHEVKVSRADWLKELSDPDKAAAIKRYCDRWWLVVPDKRIVHPDELPPDWGLMALDRNGRLRAVRVAPALTPEPIPATFRATLMRATAKTAAARARAESATPQQPLHATGSKST